MKKPFTFEFTFYENFIFVKNMSAVQQVAQFTRELLCEAA